MYYFPCLHVHYFIIIIIIWPQAHYFPIYIFSARIEQDFVLINSSQFNLGHETYCRMTCILSTFMLLMFLCIYICRVSIYSEIWTVQVLNIYFRMRYRGCYVFIVDIYSWIQFVSRVLVIRSYDSPRIRHIGRGKSYHVISVWQIWKIWRIY